MELCGDTKLPISMHLLGKHPGHSQSCSTRIGQQYQASIPSSPPATLPHPAQCVWSPYSVSEETLAHYLQSIERLFPYPHTPCIEKSLYLLHLHRYNTSAAISALSPQTHSEEVTKLIQTRQTQFDQYDMVMLSKSSNQFSKKHLFLKSPLTASLSDTCFICKSPGASLLCSLQVCHKPYHAACIKQHLSDSNQWQCPAHQCRHCLLPSSTQCIVCGNGLCTQHSNHSHSICVCSTCSPVITASEEAFTQFVAVIQRGLKFVFDKVPTLGKKPLELLRVFRIVCKAGGGSKVTEKKQWKQIGRELELPSTITNASSMLRKHYLRLLLPIEILLSN